MISAINKLFITALCATLTPLADAQTPPDAGALQQLIERDRVVPLPRPILPKKPAAPPTMKPGAENVVVTAFSFAGNTLLSAEQLAPAIAQYLNRPLDFNQLHNQLQVAAVAVAQIYRDAGWVVRAYLPAKDIESGIVSIQIVEAVFGHLLPEGESRRVKLTQIIAPFNARQKVGEPFNANALDRAILIADDLPGVSVASTLRQGAADKETDVVLKLSDESLFYGDGVDNTGSRSTGAVHVTVNSGLNSPFGLGDQAAANLLHTEGSDYRRLTYSLPLRGNGWRIGANASYLYYQLIVPEFKSMDGKGDSVTWGLEGRYPLFRSKLNNLNLSSKYLSSNLDRKTFNNKANAATTSDYAVNALGLGLSSSLYDNLAGGGANSGSLTLVGGQVDLDGSPNQAGDAAGARTEGHHYGKLRYALSRQQVIPPEFSVNFAWSGQRAGKNLDSSEKFSLGGVQGVRAYSGSEGSGSEGDLLNLELRWRCRTTFTSQLSTTGGASPRTSITISPAHPA
jgi:hemolysin activation/secretion protein